jgi:hypothetical protein
LLGWRAAKSELRRPARKNQFIEVFQADLPSPVPYKKIIRFAANPNHIDIPHRPVPIEGRFAIVTNAGRDAVDASGASDEGALLADGKGVWS